MPQPGITVDVAARFNDSQLSREANRASRVIERSMGSLGHLPSYSKNFSQFEKSIDAAVHRVAAFGLTAGIFLTVKKSIESLVKSTIEVEKAFTDINVVLNLSSKSLEKFGRDIFQIAKDTGTSFKTATDATIELSRQGLGAIETQKRLKDALILSRLAGMDAKSAVESLTATINSFSNSIIDSTDLVNKFARVDAAFAVSSKDFAEAIKRVGSTAQDAGIDIDELIGLITSLQQTTARGGAIIGNSLKTLLTRTGRSSIVKELELTDIKVRNVNEQSLGILDNVTEALEILDNVAKGFEKLAPSKQTKLAEQIGSLYQINQLRSLLKDLQKGDKGSIFGRATSLSRQEGTEALARMAQLNQTLSDQVNRAALNIKQAFGDIGKSGGLGSGMKVFVDAFNELFERFNKRDSQTLGGQFGDGFAKGISKAILGPFTAMLSIWLGRTFARGLRDLIAVGKSLSSLVRQQSSGLSQQTSLYQSLSSQTRQRLNTEQQILATIQAQHAALANVAGQKVGKFGTGQLFGVRGGFSTNPSVSMPGGSFVPIPSTAGSFFTFTKGGIPAIPGGRASTMGKMGNITKRLNEMERIRLFENDPQMIRVIDEERKIAQRELGSLRNQLGGINSQIEQRVQMMQTPQRERMNIFSSLHARRRSQSESISETVMLNQARQAGFAALELRDRQEAQAMDQKLSALRRRDQLVWDVKTRGGEERLRGPATRLFGGGNARKELANLDPQAFKAVQEQRTGTFRTIGMASTIIGPMMGGIGSGFVDTSTRRGRGLAAGISGAGDTIGMAGLGAAFGLTPIGIAAVGAVGGLAALVSVLKELGTVLPEVNARAERAKEVFANAQDRAQKINMLGEQAEGFRTGRIKPTEANLRNFSNQVSTTLSGLPTNLQLMGREAILSGNPEMIEAFNTMFMAPSAKGDTIETFIKSIHGLGSMKGGTQEERRQQIMNFITGMSALPTKTGGTFGEFLGGEAGASMLGKVTFPETIVTRPGNYGNALESKNIPLNLSPFAQLFGTVGNSQQSSLVLSSLQEAFKNNPEMIKELFQTLPSALPKDISSATYQDIRDILGVPKVVPEFDQAAAVNQMLKSLNQTSMGISAASSLGLGLMDADLSTLDARNQAALMRAPMGMSPAAIVRFRGGLEEGKINKVFDRDLMTLRGQTAGGLVESLKGFSKVLPESMNRFPGMRKQVEEMERISKDIAAGKPGAISAFRKQLTGFEGSIQDNAAFFNDEKLNDALRGMMFQLNKSEEAERDLNIQREANLNSLKTLTEAQEQMALPLSQALESVRRFKDSLDVDVATFEEMNSRGLMFSGERASSRLDIFKRRILRGDLKGSNLMGSMGTVTADQFSFGVKDAYADILDATADFSSTLKSSFKDTFINIIRGSESVGDALRNFGLALADKLLERSVNFGVDALLGGIMNLGSAAIGSFRSNRGVSTGATGGLVTGGSGIRDDVPAMLNEGDFVLRKSAVRKYGAGALVKLNSGNSNLSNFALTDENNPQNTLRMQREADDLDALVSYLQARRAYKGALKQRRISALINMGTSAAGYGLGAWGNSIRQPTVRGTYDAPAGYGSQYANYVATGGLMTRGGVKRYAAGGSVDNVPALLTGGEFVVNRNAVSRIGVGMMHKINRGEVPAFNTGGYVGEMIEGGGGGNSLTDSLTKLTHSNERLRTVLEKDKGVNNIEGAPTNNSPLVGNISISINMNKNGEAKADVQTQGGITEDSVNDGKRIGELIKATVMDTLVKETRNGGFLEQRFKRRV